MVCWDNCAHQTIIRAVKRTLKNKLPKNTLELKGNDLAFSIKKYFLKEANKNANWRLYAAIANKKSWIKHHMANHYHEPEKKVLYDEIARRLISQLDSLERTQYINIVIDRSKNKDEITTFDQAITAALTKRLTKNTRLTIKHRNSKEDAGLQAIDVFCAGIGKKYEKADLIWYSEFADKIAAEIEYKF